MDEGLKSCSMCKTTKSLDKFQKDKHSKTGRGSRCLECVASNSREYYQKNAEMRKPTAVKYSQLYRQNNTETIAASKKVYRQANAEEIATKAALYKVNLKRVDCGCGGFYKDIENQKSRHCKTKRHQQWLIDPNYVPVLTESQKELARVLAKMNATAKC